MPLFQTTVIESNSNPQFVIAAFELLKKKTMSRTTEFAKYTSLDISLTEKLNSLYFSSQTLFRSKVSNENKVDEYTVKGVIALLGIDFIIFHFIYAWPIFWESKQRTKKGREERGL